MIEWTKDNNYVLQRTCLRTAKCNTWTRRQVNCTCWFKIRYTRLFLSWDHTLRNTTLIILKDKFHENIFAAFFIYSRTRMSRASVVWRSWRAGNFSDWKYCFFSWILTCSSSYDRVNAWKCFRSSAWSGWSIGVYCCGTHSSGWLSKNAL